MKRQKKFEIERFDDDSIIASQDKCPTKIDFLRLVTQEFAPIEKAVKLEDIVDVYVRYTFTDDKWEYPDGCYVVCCKGERGSFPCWRAERSVLFE